MTELAYKVANMVDMLPSQDQSLAFEVVKKLVLAWDPDYTKLTASERQELEQAEKEMEAGDYIPGDCVNWD